MQKIKVLHLIKTLGLGGAETNLYNLVRATDPRRFEIHVGYSYGGEIEAAFKLSGVRLFKYARGSHRIKSFATVGIVLRLAAYILRNRIRIVHTHNFNSHVWGVLAAKLAGAKLVEHVHDFRYLEPEDFRRRRGDNAQYKYTKYLKSLSDRVIVLTRQNRDFLLEHGFCGEDRIAEIQNGIPFPLERPHSPGGRRLAAERLGVPEDARVVLTSARIAPEKNIDLVMRIAPEVLRRVPDAVFVITGDGPLLEEFRAQARAAGLEKAVRFVGFRSDVYDLLALADVFLLPSFLELHSIAILEAMSMKVPVVVSRDVGCNSEFIRDRENGVLLDPFSEAGWAEEIVRLLADDEVRRAMGESGFETCRSRFHIDTAAKKKEKLYAELVGQ